jgi:hypothetical protein
LKIKPQRALADDMQLQSGLMSYGGSASVSVPAGIPRQPSGKPATKHDCGCGGPDSGQCHCHDKKPAAPAEVDGPPDFARMTPAEKLAYNKAKRDRIFG